MKRFKVVQDAKGEWGIYDARDPWREASFASWGKKHCDRLDEIVDWAIKLNKGTAKAQDFHWTWYYPKASK